MGSISGILVQENKLCSLGPGLTHFVLFTHSQLWGKAKSQSWPANQWESCKPTPSPEKRHPCTWSSGSTPSKPYAWPKKSSPEEGFFPGEGELLPMTVAAIIAPPCLPQHPQGESESPEEDCPMWQCWGRWDGEKTTCAWELGLDQKQDLGVKARRS